VKSIAAVLILSAIVHAQSAVRPQFDAASIEPNPSPSLRSVLLPPVGGRLSSRFASLRLLIQNAYGVQSFQLAGGPDWVGTAGFDLEAKAEGDPSRSEIMLMLRSLLEERFALKLHRETRELPVYVLTAAKRGLNLPKPKEDCSDPGTGACGQIVLGADGRCCLFARGRQIAMPDLTRSLSGILARTVIDKSGAVDKFDLNLEWSFDELSVGMPRPVAPDPPVRPSILDALDQQLGLKLTSAKGPVEVLVIDHVERTTAN
jgi:uncharacterized protein (TIGR03435 family)